MADLLRSAFLGLALFAAAGLSAAPPSTLNYQGRLRTSGGAPVPDSSGNTVLFRLCEDPACATPVWTELWDTGSSHVATQDGLFNVALGTYSPIGAPFDKQYYLEITWTNLSGTPETLLPRQPLTLAPYAFRAPQVQLPLSQSVTAATQRAVEINNLGAGPGTIGIWGQSDAGTGLQGVGLTGTSGIVNAPGGIGVFASANAWPGALGLRVLGDGLFQSGSVTFAAHVDFSGATVTGLAAGEANTASNQGSGAGIFDGKVGVDLQFRGLSTPAGGVLTVTANIAAKTLLIDLIAGGAAASDSLIWNGLKWAPAKVNPATGLSSGGATIGNFLQYNGTNWTPISQINPTSGLSAGGAAGGQVLTYNGTNWAPATPAAVGAPLSLTLNSGVAAPLAVSNASGTGMLAYGGSRGIVVTTNAVGVSATGGSGYAIYGRKNGGTAAVQGENDGAGAGVLGLNYNASGIGVWANATGASAKAVLAEGGLIGLTATSTSSTGYAISAQSNASTANLYARNYGSGQAIYGENLNGVGANAVHGNVAQGTGVMGWNNNGANYAGVMGDAGGGGGNRVYGVWGRVTTANAGSIGVLGSVSNPGPTPPSAFGGAGAAGVFLNSNPNGYGVLASATGTGGVALAISGAVRVPSSVLGNVADPGTQTWNLTGAAQVNGTHVRIRVTSGASAVSVTRTLVANSNVTLDSVILFTHSINGAAPNLDSLCPVIYGPGLFYVNMGPNLHNYGIGQGFNYWVINP